MSEFVRTDVYAAHREADQRRLQQLEQQVSWAFRLVITSSLGLTISVILQILQAVS